MRKWSTAAVIVVGWIVAGGSAQAEPATAAARPAPTVAEAERLAATEGDVHVPGAALPVEVARRLAEHERGRLVFTKLARLSPEAARELALGGRGELRLPALVEPGPRTLHELAAFDGMLALDGVRSLPTDVAERFKERRRKTSLRGVTRIGDKETTWRAWAGPAVDAKDATDDASDVDGEDDDPEEDDIPREKSRRGRRGGDPDEDDTDGDADDRDDSGIIGDDG